MTAKKQRDLTDGLFRKAKLFQVLTISPENEWLCVGVRKCRLASRLLDHRYGCCSVI